MAWTPIGKRGDGDGRTEITNRIATRIEAKKAKRVMTMQKAELTEQKAELTEQKAELKKMNLALKQSSKAEHIPVFHRKNTGIMGVTEKKLNDLINKTGIPKRTKQFLKAKKERRFIRLPGVSREPRMDEEGFYAWVDDVNQDPMDSDTRKHMKTLVKKFQGF